MGARWGQKSALLYMYIVTIYASALSWTRCPAVVRQCVFICLGGMTLEGGLKRSGGMFSVGYFQNLANSCWFLQKWATPDLILQLCSGFQAEPFSFVLNPEPTNTCEIGFSSPVTGNKQIHKSLNLKHAMFVSVFEAVTWQLFSGNHLNTLSLSKKSTLLEHY